MQAVLTRHPAVPLVLNPQGHLNAEAAAELRHQLATVLSSRRPFAVLVDLSKVESVDSTGLMVLVSALRMAQQLNRRFSLCSVSASVRIIFELTQLDRVFEIFPCPEVFEAALISQSGLA